MLFTKDVFIVTGLLLLVIIICIRTRKLTVTAALTAGVVGFLVFAGTGYNGLLLLGTFFTLGVLATAHRKDVKAGLHPEGAHPQARNAWQVLANGGTAALMAVMAIIHPAHAFLYHVMLAASLAAATSDTLSSELGMVYGRNHYNILTFKKDIRGLDGVVSLEGTLIGAAGAFIIAAVYALGIGFNRYFLFIGLAGILGNLADSVLGASLERRHYINNDVVNFLNTLFAAFCAWLFSTLM
ncbi:TIGR00297 family protein [Chitinophaga rupis]|uniref:TIGR00297 family protein n=1 Tax=Chitinophaga rupis TaxID=573321 RepID=A0A1H7REB6_9BACT|nr:DUF92 domain-containing protein [Chitinophaga rupis]SEL58284.1 TIGR00297 family protein [Chitinophaga rupis]